MSGSSRQLTLWKYGVRSTMRAASQLPGKGPTDVDDALHLHVYQKSDYYYDDMFCLFLKGCFYTGFTILNDCLHNMNL